MKPPKPSEPQKCTRCGHPTDQISVTGPYRTCPACTQKIRN